MLYKKVHRQYLREFRTGRKFKFYDDNIINFNVTREPYFVGRMVCIDENRGNCKAVLSILSGRVKNKEIVWLD